MRFWQWLYAFAARNLCEAWMNKYNHDRKCPNCKTWGALSGGFKSARQIDEHRQGLTCRKCGYESVWFTDSMLPVLFTDQPAHVPVTTFEDVSP